MAGTQRNEVRAETGFIFRTARGEGRRIRENPDVFHVGTANSHESSYKETSHSCQREAARVKCNHQVFSSPRLTRRLKLVLK